MTYFDHHSIRPGQPVYTKSRGMSGRTPGEHVGTVDHIDGNAYVKLKRRDAPDRRHHWFPIDWVDRVEDNALYLTCTLEAFERGLIDSDPVKRTG